MKNLMMAAVLFAAAPAMAQTSVGIGVGQPNFYGHIDIGGYAPPPVYSAQPVIIERQARYLGPPIYLRVPLGQRTHWRRHCRAYNACGRQVFFVQDGWYSNTYAPRYRQQHFREQQRPVIGHGFHHGRGHGEGHGHGGGHGGGHGQGHGGGHGQNHGHGPHRN